MGNCSQNPTHLQMVRRGFCSWSLGRESPFLNHEYHCSWNCRHMVLPLVKSLAEFPKSLFRSELPHNHTLSEKLKAQNRHVKHTVLMIIYKTRMNFLQCFQNTKLIATHKYLPLFYTFEITLVRCNMITSIWLPFWDYHVPIFLIFSSLFIISLSLLFSA